MIHFSSLLALSVALHATPGADSDVGRLADDLARAVTARLTPPDATVVGRDGENLILDTPLRPGTHLVWRVPGEAIRDPSTLAVIGRLHGICGEAQVTAVDGEFAIAAPRARPGCPVPTVGDEVHGHTDDLRLTVRAGDAPAPVAGLRDLLVAVLPGRLERAGRFQFVPETSQIPVDLELRIDTALTASRLDVLLQIISLRPAAGRADVIHIQRSLAPEMLWRRRSDHEPFGLDSTAVDGEVLAMLQEPSGRSLAVLTEQHLYRLLTEGGSLELREELSLTALEPAVAFCRLPAGRLARDGDGVICFATDRLAHGWCLARGEPRQLDGVPLVLDDELYLTRYQPGTNILDGDLRRRDGTPAASIGPFLDLRQTVDGILILRPGGQLEHRRNPQAEPTIVSRRTGDAVAISAGRLIESAATGLDQPDRIQLTDTAGNRRRLPASAPISAVATIDVDLDGRDEIAVATVSGSGSSRITIHRP